MSVFGKYSAYYNLLYKDKDYAAEAEYVHSLIQKYNPKAKSILNLGCGTGRHDYLLAEKGYLVTGVDSSEEMLAVANSQLSTLNSQSSSVTPHHSALNSHLAQPSTLNFLHGDIRIVQLNNKFDAVISLFHVMSYQTTNEDLMAAFKTAKTHLKAGGVFIFDFWYGPAVLTDRPAVRVKKLEDEELSVYRTATPVMHMNENVVDVNYEVLIEDKKTNSLDTLHETHRMRYFFLPELKFMLRSAGFSIAAELAWMHLDKGLSTDSWNGLLVAGR